MPPGWRLDKPESFDVASAKLTTSPRDRGTGHHPVANRYYPGRCRPHEHLSTLSHDRSLRAGGRRTSELESKWWHKMSGPLAALLMPLLGSVAAFGLARSGQLFVRAIIGMALGFTYFVVDNLSLAVGNFGGYPPLMAAWAPLSCSCWWAKPCWCGPRNRSSTGQLKGTNRLTPDADLSFAPFMPHLHDLGPQSAGHLLP
jgi:hypothetical protein